VLLATVLGVGAYTKQDLPRALDLLQLGAERGSAHARHQLAILAGSPELALQAQSASGDIWKQLKACIDVATWSAPVDVQTLCDDPRIGRVRRLVSDDVCQWMIDRSRNRLVRARSYNSLEHVVQESEMRNNTTAIFGLLEADLVSTYIQMRMASAAGVLFNHMEAAAVLHYSVGERITEHYDFVDPRTPDYVAQIAKDGQRIVTFLLYLNDDYEGGETEFPRLNISHKGRKGEGLFFFNADKSLKADTRTLHAGRPPSRGEKWIVSQFVRSLPATPGSEFRH
jgi:hypothetical protein